MTTLVMIAAKDPHRPLQDQAENTFANMKASFFLLLPSLVSLPIPVLNHEVA